MSKLTIVRTIEILGINPYIHISPEEAQSIKLNWRKPMPVLIRVNGVPKTPWQINMMPVGDGSFYLYLHGDVRKVSNTNVGDEVSVEIEFDANYKNGPMHPMPNWFKDALDENSQAKKNWESLIPSRQKEILRYLVQLKSDEAKERNLKKVIEVLQGNSGRFMARSWNKGK